MEVVDYTLHSEELDRDFDVTVYGDAGWPVIAFPEGDSTCTSWENNRMTDALSSVINGGKVQLFCVDSMDEEGWYASNALPEYRLENVRSYYEFVHQEFVPFVCSHTPSERKPILAGAGIGAVNAVVTLLQDPAPFGGLLALSGTYDVRRFVEGDLDEGWLEVSPVDLAEKLTKGQVAQLRGEALAFVCGQHQSEDGIDTQRALDTVFAQLQVGATFEYWGYDVSHDWAWWHEEARQLLPCLIRANGLEERKLVAQLSAAQAEVDHAVAIMDDQSRQLEQAQRTLEDAKTRQKDTQKRLEHESQQVSDCAKREDELCEAARQAWAKRDEAVRVLDEATKAGEAAQAQADQATEARQKAEWIAGEARSDAERAKNDAEAATTTLQERQAATEAAEEAANRAKAMFQRVKATFEAEKREAQQKAEAAAEEAKAEPAAGADIKAEADAKADAGIMADAQAKADANAKVEADTEGSPADSAAKAGVAPKPKSAASRSTGAKKASSGSRSTATRKSGSRGASASKTKPKPARSSSTRRSGSRKGSAGSTKAK